MNDSSARWPKRIQMSRQHPWRAEHPDAVIVARPSKWGNGFRVVRAGSRWQVRPSLTGDLASFKNRADAITAAVEMFRETHRRHINLPDAYDARRELAGRDLACWCPLDSPCHADVLLEIANARERGE